MQLDDCVALVTGASSGIGEATARQLAACGATVVVVARRADRLDTVVAAIRADGGDAYAQPADITDRDQARAAVEQVVAERGRLDILINNAGALAMGPVAEADEPDWQQMLAVNVQGLVHVTQAALPHLVQAATSSARGLADVVNVGSTSAHTQRPGTAMYSLTKAGVAAFTESLRQEMVPESVRVSLVEPGTVATDLIGGSSTGPGGVELLQPDDVADVITFVVTRRKRLALNRILLRAGEQTW